MPYAGNTPAVWNDVYTGTFTDANGEQFFGSRNFIIEYELTSQNAESCPTEHPELCEN